MENPTLKFHYLVVPKLLQSFLLKVVGDCELYFRVTLANSTLNFCNVEWHMPVNL